MFMSVNKPDEWNEFRKWFGARVDELHHIESHADSLLIDRARAEFSGIFESGAAAQAVDHLERLLAMAWSAEGAALLRHYLAYALAARTVEVRDVTRDGTLAFVERSQLEACERLARSIQRLETDDPDLEDFAADLLDRLAEGQRWRWSGVKAALSFAGLVVLLGVLPVVCGGLLDSTPTVMFGALVGAVLVFVFVVRHRKQRWLLDAEALAPLVWRHGR
jgi:hypothetical protein